PRADAGGRVGRDIGRVDRAERRRHGATAGERLPPVRRVAGLAIAGEREVAAALDRRMRAVAGDRRGHGGAGGGGQRRRGDDAEHVVARHLQAADISGPGFLRYWLRIASAAQYVSAPTVPVGL